MKKNLIGEIIPGGKGGKRKAPEEEAEPEEIFDSEDDDDDGDDHNDGDDDDVLSLPSSNSVTVDSSVPQKKQKGAPVPAAPSPPHFNGPLAHHQQVSWHQDNFFEARSPPCGGGGLFRDGWNRNDNHRSHQEPQTRSRRRHVMCSRETFAFKQQRKSQSFDTPISLHVVCVCACFCTPLSPSTALTCPTSY